MGKYGQTFGEKRNIFRFQDRAKNSMPASSARSEKDRGRGTVAPAHAFVYAGRRDAERDGARRAIRPDPRRGQARQDGTRIGRGVVAVRLTALKGSSTSLCCLVTVVSGTTDVYGEVSRTCASRSATLPPRSPLRIPSNLPRAFAFVHLDVADG